jgi:hypothetical protein
MRQYILDGHTPIQAPNPLRWAQWMETADCHVADTMIGPLRISTIFLGIDHGFGNGEPILFETMIFGFDENDSYRTHCRTWDQAERMHVFAKDIAETLVREADNTLAGFMAKLTFSNDGTIS